MGSSVSALSAAAFRAHQLPPGEPLASVAEQFLVWWREGAEAERIVPEDADFAVMVLRALAAEARAALLKELLLDLPFELMWKAPVLLRAAGSDTASIEALRELVVSWEFNARDNVASWLIERNALGVAELGLLLEDSSCRRLAAFALESFSAEALQPLGDKLARFAAVEKGKHARRALANAARKTRGRKEPGGVEELDAASLAARVEVDWDARGQRAVTQRRLEKLLATPDGSGLVQLLRLMYPNAPEDEEPDNDEWLTFWDTSSPPRQLELGQVPALVFSEVVRELTPKSARSRQQTSRHAKLASRQTGTKEARASNSACTDEICGLVTRLAGSPERRADARRLAATLDERAQRLIEVFTTGKARSDAEACALLGLMPDELTELTSLVLRTFAPVLGH